MKLGYDLPIHILGPHHYILTVDMPYYSKRYNRTTTAVKGFECDGATGAQDILTRGWVHHDWLRASGLNPAIRGMMNWDDGTPCTPLQSSMVLYDCLREDGYWIRAPFWMLVTWGWAEFKTTMRSWLALMAIVSLAAPLDKVEAGEWAPTYSVRTAVGGAENVVPVFSDKHDWIKSSGLYLSQIVQTNSSGGLDWGGAAYVKVPWPTYTNSAANKAYVDTNIDSLSTGKVDVTTWQDTNANFQAQIDILETGKIDRVEWAETNTVFEGRIYSLETGMVSVVDYNVGTNDLRSSILTQIDGSNYVTTATATDMTNTLGIADRAYADGVAANGNTAYGWGNHNLVGYGNTTVVYRVSGTLTPDATGDYWSGINYSGEPVYWRTDGAYALFAYGVANPIVILSACPGQYDPSWDFIRDPYTLNISGAYGPGWSATGTATVTRVYPLSYPSQTPGTNVALAGESPTIAAWQNTNSLLQGFIDNLTTGKVDLVDYNLGTNALRIAIIDNIAESNYVTTATATDMTNTLGIADRAYADAAVQVGTNTLFTGPLESYTNVPKLNSANWGTLTGDSMADTLHRHSELSASDGTPDQAVFVDATGQVGIGTDTPLQKLDVRGWIRLLDGGGIQHDASNYYYAGPSYGWNFFAGGPVRFKIGTDGKVVVYSNLTFSIGTSVNEFSTDGTMSGNSTTAVPVEAAVKTYVGAVSNSVASLIVHPLIVQSTGGLVVGPSPYNDGQPYFNPVYHMSCPVSESGRVLTALLTPPSPSHTNLVSSMFMYWPGTYSETSSVLFLMFKFEDVRTALWPLGENLPWVKPSADPIYGSWSGTSSIPYGAYVNHAFGLYHGISGRTNTTAILFLGGSYHWQ